MPWIVEVESGVEPALLGCPYLLGHSGRLVSLRVLEPLMEEGFAVKVMPQFAVAISQLNPLAHS